MKKSLVVTAAAVLALASYGCGVGNNVAAPTTALDSAPPQAPVGLAVAVDASNQRIVEWSANSESDLNGYQVYQYSPDPTRDNAYVLVATLAANQTSWPLPTVGAATTSWIKLRALDASGNRSAESAALQVQLLPVPAGGDPPSGDPQPHLH